ncbi:unnamed protein product [Linum tenue]|uniref:Uncharacterized protein n=1 Tax=Linum tenue TaxID=586396 RepID=A0AAV0KY42_9ROSI|nr:unnamed protein product [Linum tenue]
MSTSLLLLALLVTTLLLQLLLLQQRMTIRLRRRSPIGLDNVNMVFSRLIVLDLVFILSM